MSFFPCCVICYECGCGQCGRNTEKAFYGKSEQAWLNVLCAPVALVLHSLYAYLFNCIYIYTARILNHACCFACVHMDAFKKCYMYKDEAFQPDEIALGKSENQYNIIWKRAPELIHNPVLFQPHVKPSDVVQGNLGNSWLMSAIACMAEFPALVDKVFVTRELSTRGKYQVSLYNAYYKRWQIVTVDDYFPVKDNTEVLRKEFPVSKAGMPNQLTHTSASRQLTKQEAPIDLEKGIPDGVVWEYACPQKNELWVCILEKAFAKFRGSYESLQGGNMLWAFQCLTGDNVFRMQKNAKGSWERFILEERRKPDEVGEIGLRSSGHTLRDDELFDFLRTYDRSKALVGASSIKKTGANADGVNYEEVDEDTGLVRGHSYSIITAKRMGNQGYELLKLRNPWGKFEWTGDWSDKSDMWKKHPDIKRALKPEDADDGTFWMEMKDFIRHFDSIDICDRTVNYADFHLNVHENADNKCQHWLGPLRGCLEGCFDYWVLCEGVRLLYCGHDSQVSITQSKRKGTRDDTIFSGFSSVMV